METVTLGWVVRIQYQRRIPGDRYLYPKMFWSTLFDDREYAEALFEEWSAFRLPEIEGIGVVFETADGEKCQRCWKILPDVGTHAHPGTCARCDEAALDYIEHQLASM